MMTSHTDQIRALLDEAPSTAYELARLVKVGDRAMLTALWRLMRRGEVQLTGRVMRKVGHAKGHQIYELTSGGHAALQGRQKGESENEHADDGS
jgi:predicted ArsR family transcriptional regulator